MAQLWWTIISMKNLILLLDFPEDHEHVQDHKCDHIPPLKIKWQRSQDLIDTRVTVHSFLAKQGLDTQNLNDDCDLIFSPIFA